MLYVNFLLEYIYHNKGDAIMKACGLIVEYNPFHNGHLYHIQEAKKVTKADVLIGIMSGSFLQRGEPAIIDKFHRTKAALQAGIDIIIELPYRYAVQSSELFAYGAVHLLKEIRASSLCFGSESGDIDDFKNYYTFLKKHHNSYENALKHYLLQGYSYPMAHQLAYEQINSTDQTIVDLSKPNNILGFSYIKTIYDDQLNIQPYTIQRKSSDFHEEEIQSPIASATSIRKYLSENGLTGPILKTIPESSKIQLEAYQNITSLWHTWENYFSFIRYRVLTMTIDELQEIKGMDEGIEYRIKKFAKEAQSMKQWIERVKTKRYTWTRIQRIFVHILTHTKKRDYELLEKQIPYIRILGMSKNGRAYIRQYKKSFQVPILTQITRDQHPMLTMEEKATEAYYSIFPPKIYNQLKEQEKKPPILF